MTSYLHSLGSEDFVCMGGMPVLPGTRISVEVRSGSFLSPRLNELMIETVCVKKLGFYTRNNFLKLLNPILAGQPFRLLQRSAGFKYMKKCLFQK